MNDLLTAIYSKFSGSDLSSDVGGRIYLDTAPEKTEFPYIVYFIISSTQDRTFTEYYTNILIQFSLFSISSSVTEIITIYNHLKALFDEYSFDIIGNKLVWMREQNLITMIDNITTLIGTEECRHWAVDFEVLTSLN